MAGDGKLAGIYMPTDGRCHLNENGEYYQSNMYVSIILYASTAKHSLYALLFLSTARNIVGLDDCQLIDVRQDKSVIFHKPSMLLNLY